MEFRKALLRGASEQRLASLMEARSQEGADTDAIDRRIWDLFGERWAVMFTDLSGRKDQSINHLEEKVLSSFTIVARPQLKSLPFYILAKKLWQSLMEEF